MKRKKLVIVLIVIAAVVVGAGYGVGEYFVNYALSPSSSSGERNVDGTEIYTYEFEEQEEAIGEAYSQTTEPVYLTNQEGLLLHADMTRNEDSHIWAILIHGYKADNSNMMLYGARYAERGYNVLLPDCRAHGQSEGEYIGMGWLDKDDIIEWIEWIAEQDPEAQVILHGVSMGAATTMMVSGENPDYVIGYVEDCGYTSVWDIFASELKLRFSLPAFPALNLCNLVAQQKAGYNFKKASSLDQVAKCEMPMLFIHGTADDFVPLEMGYQVYEAAQCEKELFLVEDAGHARSAIKDPDAYWEKVFEFIDTEMLTAS